MVKVIFGRRQISVDITCLIDVFESRKCASKLTSKWRRHQLNMGVSVEYFTDSIKNENKQLLFFKIAYIQIP